MTWKNKFQIALWSVVLFQVLMFAVRPDNGSILKIVITLLLGFSVFLTVEYLLVNHQYIKKVVPGYAFFVFILLILLNSINIIRGSMDEGVTLTTTFGNPYNALALLTPFALGFGVNKSNLRNIYLFFIFLTSIGFIAAVVLMGIWFVGNIQTNYIQAAFVMVSPVIFLIGTVSYQNRKNKYFIYIASFFLFVFGVLVISQRAIPLRLFLLYLSNIAVYFCWKYRFRWVRSVAICTLLLPFIIIIISVNSGQSFFYILSHSATSSFGKSNSYSELDTSDTRTFLYTEVYNDLKRANSLLFGKGSSGTYYSPFFHYTRGDSDTRLTVEVGILALLLKGGIVAVTLNLLLYYIAIYLALFKANNQYVMWIGFMILTHTFILFIENIPAYNIYNISIWFFTGICLSQEARELSDQDIKSYFSNEHKRFLKRIL